MDRRGGGGVVVLVGVGVALAVLRPGEVPEEEVAEEEVAEEEVAEEAPVAAPTVVSSTPTPGSTGVRSDTKVVLRFNVPMDPVSTQAAFQSPDISGTFAWNADNTELTVTPASPFDLGSSAGASTYAYSLTTVAKGADGQRIEPAFDASFTMLYRLTATLDVKHGAMPNVGNIQSSYCYDDNPNSVGPTKYSDKHVVLVAAFDLSTIPTTAEVESATHSIYVRGCEGNPFSGSRKQQLGRLMLNHVHLGSKVAMNAVSSGQLGTVGELTSSCTAGTRTNDVRDAVLDDLANLTARGGESQYRIAFESPYVADPPETFMVQFDCVDHPQQLSITYLTPDATAPSSRRRR